jgi:(1->4)-alpha-D-glucan 1-alpha-D-glucosylmutase
VDVLTGERHSGGTVRLADLLRQYPVALLVADDFDDTRVMED